MAKTDDMTAMPGDGTAPPVEPAASAPDQPHETRGGGAESVAAAANDAAPSTIKVRLKMSPDVETELIGGEAERLDLERQGFLVTDHSEGGK